VSRCGSVVLGVGSPHGDDRLGWLALEMIRQRLPVPAVTHRVGGALDLLDYIEGHDDAFIIDALAPAGAPGAIRVFSWPCPEAGLPSLVSSHGLGVIESLRLAETLGKLPRHVRLYTIEARDTSPAEFVSSEVAEALEGLVPTVLRDIATAAARQGLGAVR
jgi:hydrogenase maturation protease